MKFIKKNSNIGLPCFFCQVDSTELKLFLIFVIGGLVISSLFFFLGLYFRGKFKNSEELNDLPNKLEEYEDNL
jgi:hypothetical protein